MFEINHHFIRRKKKEKKIFVHHPSFLFPCYYKYCPLTRHLSFQPGVPSLYFSPERAKKAKSHENLSARCARARCALLATMADNRLAPTSSGAGISHLGTITADVFEEDRAGFIVNNDQEMLEANAVLEAEAEGREKLETLQYQLKTKRSQMKILQECTSPTPPSQRSPQRPRSPPDTGVHTALLCAFLLPCGE
jgi:hypothetical protein